MESSASLSKLTTKTFELNSEIISKQTYNYMVVAALQEELNEFYELTSKLKRHERKKGGAVELLYTGETT